MHLIKQNCFLKNFSNNSNLDDSGISSLVFLSRTNSKLYIISVTHNMVKRVITNLDSTKSSYPDYIPVVVLKNCESELSYASEEVLFSRLLEGFICGPCI